MYLPDINFWLALIFDAHSHHAAAKAWMDGLSKEICYFCRMTQQAFLRLANNPRVFPTDAVSMADAWRLYDIAISDPRVAFAEEPAGIEARWRVFTQHKSFSPQAWNDAYLAAFAAVGKLQLVTFDKAFAQYQNVTCTILT